MKPETTCIDGLKIILPDVFEDERGYFLESFSERAMQNLGINAKFVQDNHSLSLRAGTLRGLHLQNEPMAQTKLVRCTRGAIFDVCVDLRNNSATYKKWVSVILSEYNKKQLFIPKGFLHGFLTLVDNTEVQYKVDNFYSKDHEYSVRYNDPELAIDWGTDAPILSDKDLNAPFLSDAYIIVDEVKV